MSTPTPRTWAEMNARLETARGRFTPAYLTPFDADATPGPMVYIGDLEALVAVLDTPPTMHEAALVCLPVHMPRLEVRPEFTYWDVDADLNA
jgi:hypothetical protein